MDKIIKKIDNLINDNLKYNELYPKLIEIYFEIGSYLFNNKNKFNYKIIYDTEQKLRNRYGLLIGFSRRNLNNMIKFYETYHDYNIDILKKINWDKHLIIMKQQNKNELMEYCINYNITNNNLRKIIKNGFAIKYTNEKKVIDDNMTLEFIKLSSN